MPTLIPSAIQNNGQQQVDYFSYAFDPLDLHSCWKSATKLKDISTHQRRCAPFQVVFLMSAG